MKLDRKAYIYSIDYKNRPIYIGSCVNIASRETTHNKELVLAKESFGHTQRLYNYLYDKIEKIKLKPIKEFYDDIVLIGTYKLEYRKLIEEEKAIRYCFEKGIQLLNVKWPCKFWHDKEGKIYERRHLEDFKIPLHENYNYGLDFDLYNFNKDSLNNEEKRISLLKEKKLNNQVLNSCDKRLEKLTEETENEDERTYIQDLNYYDNKYFEDFFN